MLTIDTKNLLKTGLGLTQSFRFGFTANQLPVGELQSTVLFTRTYSASITNDHLFEIGKGHIDAQMYSRLLLQYSRDANLPSFDDLVTQFMDYLQKIALNASVWRTLVAYVTGMNPRPMKAESIAKVPPTAILEQIREIGGADQHEVFYHIACDYVCGVLAKLGFIQADAPYVFRISRINTYPDYLSLIDCVRASDLKRVLTVLADVDVGPIQATMKAKQAMLPALIAQHLGAAATTAWERSRGTYDATSIVQSVLMTMGRVWSPVTPDQLAPTTRLRSTAAVEELRPNLALFLAYQDMFKQVGAQEIAFSDEEMTSTIFPLFLAAMNDVSPFKSRSLTDSVNFIGQQSVRDHLGNPSDIIVYEDWRFDDSITAFTPLKHLSKLKASFLRVEPTISDKLSAALAPVGKALAVSSFVDHRVASMSLVPVAARGKLGTGAIMTLGFPSMLERDYAAGRTPDITLEALRSGTMPDDIEEVDRVQLERQLYNYYAAIVHYAVAHNSSVSVSAKLTEANAARASDKALYLVWRLSTELRVPVGYSAISGGEVFTTEPLEAIAYKDDVTPVEQMQAKTVDLAAYEKSLHIWDWHDASTELAYSDTYPVTVANSAYKINIREHEMLGLGAARERVRILRPDMAHAVVTMWYQWFLEDQEFIERFVGENGLGDDLVSKAFEGRQLQNAISVMQRLEMIGNSGIGISASHLVMQRLINEMAGQDLIDDISKLGVGIQKHRLAIWAGLATLRLLGLINNEQADEILTLLRGSNALAYVIATVDMEPVR